MLVGAASAAAGVLSACTGPASEVPDPSVTAPRAGASPSPTPDPDLPVVTAAIAAEQHLLAVYAATLARHPTYQARLAAYVRRHESHLSALTTLTRPGDDSGARPVTTSSPPPTGGIKVPSSAAQALAALASAENAAKAGRSKDLRTVKSSEYARLLASICACEATHATLLGAEVG